MLGLPRKNKDETRNIFYVLSAQEEWQNFYNWNCIFYHIEL
jgi:hypothetical protein